VCVCVCVLHARGVHCGCRSRRRRGRGFQALPLCTTIFDSGFCVLSFVCSYKRPTRQPRQNHSRPKDEGQQQPRSFTPRINLGDPNAVSFSQVATSSSSSSSSPPSSSSSTNAAFVSDCGGACLLPVPQAEFFHQHHCILPGDDWHSPVVILLSHVCDLSF
jgi:hypothetical protein